LEGDVTLTLTPMQQLAEIEELIVHFRHARRTPEHPEYRTWVALRMCAEDIRSRQAITVHDAQRNLQGAIDAIAQSRTALGVDVGRLQRLAEETVRHWPTIRHALELLGAKAAGGQA
jgi:hypothetical protein